MIITVVGTLRLLDFCCGMMIPTFVFACSSSACGPEAALPSAGDGPTAPSSSYALAKLHGAHGCRLDSRQHGIKVRALRFFSIWGLGQSPDPALGSFQRAIAQDWPVRVPGDGSQRRDLTLVNGFSSHGHRVASKSNAC